MTHRDRLRVPVCMGVGGLFDYWAGTLQRAPVWLRALGHEWFWLLLHQPRSKARRYLIGNPLFLVRVLAEWWNPGSEMHVAARARLAAAASHEPVAARTE